MVMVPIYWDGAWREMSNIFDEWDVMDLATKREGVEIIIKTDYEQLHMTKDRTTLF